MGEIDIPDDLDRKSVYRMRLSLETAFEEMRPEERKHVEAKLKTLADRCKDQAVYEQWKAEYFAAKYKKRKGRKFITCKYRLFVEMDQDDDIVPESICWLACCSSGVICDKRDATEEKREIFGFNGMAGKGRMKTGFKYKSGKEVKTWISGNC